MTYGLCADVHAHNWSQFSTLRQSADSSVNSRLIAIMDEFERVCAATNLEGGKRVYIAGDLFHVRGNLKTSVLNYVNVRMREAARKNDIQVRIMPGNHDLEDAEVTFLGNATMSLDDAGDHDWDDQIIQIVQEPRFFEDDMVAIVPWQNTREGMTAAVHSLQKEMSQSGEKPSDYDLHLHTGINGVLIGMPDHGWAPSELAEFGFKRTFSGHYHNHKAFKVPCQNDDVDVVSIGALTHQTWGDVGTSAGFILVDEDEFRFTESRAPKFLDGDFDRDLSDYSGNYVRIKGVELEEAEIKALKTALEDAGALGVVVQAVAKNKIVTRTGAAPSKAVKMEQSVTDWINGASEIVNSCPELEKAALDVLNEARSV